MMAALLVLSGCASDKLALAPRAAWTSPASGNSTRRTATTRSVLRRASRRIHRRWAGQADKAEVRGAAAAAVEDAAAGATEVPPAPRVPRRRRWGPWAQACAGRARVSKSSKPAARSPCPRAVRSVFTRRARPAAKLASVPSRWMTYIVRKTRTRPRTAEAAGRPRCADGRRRPWSFSRLIATRITRRSNNATVCPTTASGSSKWWDSRAAGPLDSPCRACGTEWCPARRRPAAGQPLRPRRRRPVG